MRNALIPTLTSLTFALGCAAEAPEPAATGPGLAVTVAPLTLPGIVEATYQLTVKNASGQVVWQRGPLSSTQYGDGRGALSYVGTCDAQGGLHTVELLLLSLSDTTGALTSPDDFVNPTLGPNDTPAPLVARDVICRENADTLVPFELTIMRSARQGFFDFAVEFDDIFCSAKLDCNPSLLHDGDTRSATAVLAFACASGNGQPTWLYLSDLTLTCTGPGGTTTTVLDVSPFAKGNQGAQGTDVFQWAIYQGREFLGQTDLEKCYWNHAIGLDLAALSGKTCTLSATGAATDEALTYGAGGYALPRTGSYPYVRWSAQVLSPTGQLCTNMGLNSSNGAVKTEYVYADTPPASLPALTARYSCGGPQELACATGAGAIGVTPTADGFSLSAPGSGAADVSYRLPAGYSVGTSCCAPGCCQ